MVPEGARLVIAASNSFRECAWESIIGGIARSCAWPVVGETSGVSFRCVSGGHQKIQLAKERRTGIQLARYRFLTTVLNSNPLQLAARQIIATAAQRQTALTSLAFEMRLPVNSISEVYKVAGSFVSVQARIHGRNVYWWPWPLFGAGAAARDRSCSRDHRHPLRQRALHGMPGMPWGGPCQVESSNDASTQAARNR